MKNTNIILTIVITFLSINSYSATFTSNSATTDWNTPANWTVTGGTDVDGIPDADDDVIILHDLTCATSAVANSVTFNGYQKTIAFSSDLTVTNAVLVDNNNEMEITVTGNLSAGSITTNSYQGVFNVIGNTSVTGTLINSNKSDINLSGNLTANAITLSGGVSTFDVGGTTNISQTLWVSQSTIINFGGNLSADSISITAGSSSIATPASHITSITKGINLAGSGFTFDINGGLSANSLAFSQSSITVDIAATTTTTINGLISFLGGSDAIDVHGTLYADSVYLFDGSDALNIFEGGAVYITNGMAVTGSALLEINNNGIIDIGGDFSIDGGSSATVDGNMHVAGNFDFLNGTVAVDGTLIVDQTLDLGYNTITGTGIISGNPIVCSNNCSSQISGPTILPIELVYFKSQAINNGVRLLWQTASEENNDFFTIERSVDGINFEIITTITGAGNSNTILNYSYTDTKAIAGILYYRLKQTDYNGDYSYSNAISIEYKSNLYSQNREIKVSPSPYKSGELTLTNFGTGEFTNYTINIMDLSGKTVYSTQKYHNSSNSISINPNVKFSKGFYIVTLQTPNTFGKAKILIE